MSSRWKLIAQLATLAVSAGLGIYIAIIAPNPSDPRLSNIEQAMSAEAWGWALAVLGSIGFAAELFNNVDKRERLFWLVSLCHTALFGIMVAFAASALVGVIQSRSTLWASVMLAGYLAIMHFVYIQRKHSLPPIDPPSDAEQ